MLRLVVDNSRERTVTRFVERKRAGEADEMFFGAGGRRKAEGGRCGRCQATLECARIFQVVLHGFSMDALPKVVNSSLAAGESLLNESQGEEKNNRRNEARLRHPK